MSKLKFGGILLPRTAVWGFSVLALVSSLVLAACGEDGAQEVTGSVGLTHPQIAAPAVTAVKTTDGKYLILRWNAVENASGYTVYSQQEGKVTIVSVGTGDSQYAYADADGTQSDNADVDKYSYRFSLETFDKTKAGTKSRYGVQTTPGNLMPQDTENSSVAWTDYYTLAGSPWLGLDGTWIKEGETTGPKFVITISGSYGTPRGEYRIFNSDGTTLISSSYASFSISGGNSITFSGSDSSYSQFTAALTGGNLVISNYSGSYNLTGNYTKR